VPGLWAEGARGQGIVIGEIDTGVNASLPELAGNVQPGTDFGSFGGDGRTDRDTDDFGHGTAMASLMVAHDGEDNILGIAPDARILPIAVPITGTTDDAGDNASDLLLQAIRWAADHGAKIISMSLGAPRDPGTSRSCPAQEQSTIDYALSKGAIVVASGGNSGDAGSPVEEPSVCLGVVSVGAADSSGAVRSGRPNTVPDGERARRERAQHRPVRGRGVLRRRHQPGGRDHVRRPRGDLVEVPAVDGPAGRGPTTGHCGR